MEKLKQIDTSELIQLVSRLENQICDICEYQDATPAADKARSTAVYVFRGVKEEICKPEIDVKTARKMIVNVNKNIGHFWRHVWED